MKENFTPIEKITVIVHHNNQQQQQNRVDREVIVIDTFENQAQVPQLNSNHGVPVQTNLRNRHTEKILRCCCKISGKVLCCTCTFFICGITIYAVVGAVLCMVGKLKCV